MVRTIKCVCRTGVGVRQIAAAMGAFIAIVAHGGSAWAVLGETEAQLIRRYGEPDSVINVGKGKDDEGLAPAEKLMGWGRANPDYQVIACLIDGRSEREIYTLKREVNDPDDRVVQGVLRLNENGDEWLPAPAGVVNSINNLRGMKRLPSGKYLWRSRRDDSDAVILEDDPKKLEVSSQHWNKAWNKMLDAAKAR